MNTSDLSRLRDLRERNFRRRRSLQLVRQWAQLGVAVSSLSEDRRSALVARLRQGRALQPLRPVADLNEAIRAFCRECDCVFIIGWEVNAEPALFVPTGRLLAKTSVIQSIYRDGFIVSEGTTSSALLIDFNDMGGIQSQSLELPLGS